LKFRYILRASSHSAGVEHRSIEDPDEAFELLRKMLDSFGVVSIEKLPEETAREIDRLRGMPDADRAAV
jgi:hypothetical protein